MMRRTTVLCAAASVLGSLLIAACSSFSTSTEPVATTDGGADSATTAVEDAAVQSLDAAVDANDGVSFDLQYVECSGWSAHHGASIRSVTNTSTGEHGCRVCATAGDGPPFVSKTLTPVAGKYQISATALAVGALASGTAYGVGFQTVPEAVGGSATTPASDLPVPLSKPLTLDVGTMSLQATIEIDTNNGGCADFRDLFIMVPK